MLSPEDKQILAEIMGGLQGLIEMDSDDGESTVAAGMNEEIKMAGEGETQPEEEKKDEVEKGQPTDEVTNQPADVRVGGDEDDEADAKKVVKQLVLALSNLSVKKSAPVQKAVASSELSQVLKVVKSLADETKFNRSVISDIMSGLGISAQIEKEISQEPKRSQAPYAQSNNGASLEAIQKSLETIANGNKETEKESRPDFVKKQLGGLLSGFEQTWNK